MNQSYYDKKKISYHLSGGRELILYRIIPHQAKTVLDFGCGSGDLARILKAEGRIVSGADISADALRSAEPYLDHSYCFDIQQSWPPDLLSRRFDVVVASEVIEHLFMPVEFLQRVKPLLDPAGSLVITTPNILFWKNRLRILLGSFEYRESGLMDFGHIRFFTLKTARKLFQESGFQIVKEEHFYPNLYHRGLSWLGRIFPGLFAYQFGFLLKANE